MADAAVQAIRDRKSTYTYCEGDAGLRRKIAAKLARVNGIEADPETDIVVTAGSAAAFTCVLHGLFDPGDELLIPEPYYGYHVGAAKVAGVVPAFVGLRAPAFELTEELLQAAITPRTRGLVLCTPSNPSGRMLTRVELERAARVAEEHDLIVITDEIYESITYDGREHLSPASISDAMARRTVTILGLSKTFSITGWRLGYVVAPAAMAEKLKLVHDPAAARGGGRLRPRRRVLRADEGRLRQQAGPARGHAPGDRIDPDRARGRLLHPRGRLRDGGAHGQGGCHAPRGGGWGGCGAWHRLLLRDGRGDR